MDDVSVYWDRLEKLVRDMTEIFPIGEMDALMRSSVGGFEKLRNGYKYRREFKF